jgi:hypothetical protein
MIGNYTVQVKPGHTAMRLLRQGRAQVAKALTLSSQATPAREMENIGACRVKAAIS